MRNPLQSLSIRWRLAGITALLTFVILCAFAVAVGTLTTQRIRSDFDSQITARAIDLRDRIAAVFDASDGVAHVYPKVGVEAYAAPEDAVIRVLARDGSVLLSTKRKPNLGPPAVGVSTVSGYRVETRSKRFELTDPVVGRFLYPVFIQYARPISAMENTISRVRLFLILGVLGGTGAALLGGLVLARRAMAPIAELTSTTREIARTRDPGLRVPQPEADDEVAELARTLDGMLQALDSARSETEAMLLRQREFVADASHELRTPLTSVLANLELLAESLDGEHRETAESALRSSRRMRRLVADLLLLARSDVGRVAVRAPTDIAQVVVEAAAELEAVTDGHELSVDARPAVVEGTRDELHRLALNLLENALRHTPAGTHVRAATETDNGNVTLTVEDDGPGIPPEIAQRVFERFVRGSGDRGGSFGLGLAIVRAVAESHGGSVTLERPQAAHGTRFVVRLPAA